MFITEAIKLGVKKVSINIRIIVFGFLKVINVLEAILVLLVFNCLF